MGELNCSWKQKCANVFNPLIKKKNKHKKAESIIPQFYAHIMQNIPRVLKPYPLHLLRIFFLKMQAPCNIHLQYILCV